MGFLKRLKSIIVGKNVTINEKYDSGLSKAKTGFKSRINALFARYRKIDEDFFQELEKILVESDIGGRLSFEIIENIKAQTRLSNIVDPSAIVELVIEALYNFYNCKESSIEVLNSKPHIILMVGVNGSGKTTSIAKLASMYKLQGLKVLVVAGDTFRAGAVEQLDVWAKRIDIQIVKGQVNSDPASVIYEGVKLGCEKDYDVIICDTAGRLHTKLNLMNELSKIRRVIVKQLNREVNEVLLVIDATTGQNGIYQAKAFVEATKVSGIILTKMDGTSKGGIILAIKDLLGIDVAYIGLGEGLDDLLPFEISSYLNGLFAGLID